MGENAFPKAELLERAKAGESVALTVALAAIHTRLRTHVEGHISRELQPTIDVDDVLQETQMRVFHGIKSFQNVAPGSFYRWVATIAMNHLRNVIAAQRTLKRGRARTPCDGHFLPDGDRAVSLLDWLAGPENSPSHHASRHEAHEALVAALAALPDPYQQAVRLIYLEGRSVHEVAQMMGRSDRAIHNLCYKAKEQLHLCMGSTSRFFSRP